MQSDVVFHDGYYGSLNNRHLDAHRQAQTRLPEWIRNDYKVQVDRKERLAALLSGLDPDDTEEDDVDTAYEVCSKYYHVN